MRRRQLTRCPLEPVSTQRRRDAGTFSVSICEFQAGELAGVLAVTQDLGKSTAAEEGFPFPNPNLTGQDRIRLDR